MNYLGHAYLSFGNDAMLIGNLISDFLKGKKQYDYPLDIQKGIRLHRMIDNFTDVHHATKDAREFFKSAAGRYAAVFVDVVYDHFLANDKVSFLNPGLEEFTTKTYQVLISFEYLLPQKFKRMLPFMISENWLANYRFNWGIQNSFGGIFRRAKYLQGTERVFQTFIDNYEALQDCYKRFFPDVKEFAFIEYNLLQQE